MNSSVPSLTLTSPLQIFRGQDSDLAARRTNYILIDYENVQPKNLGGLTGDWYKVLVFVGAK